MSSFSFTRRPLAATSVIVLAIGLSGVAASAALADSPPRAASAPATRLAIGVPGTPVLVNVTVDEDGDVTDASTEVGEDAEVEPAEAPESATDDAADQGDQDQQGEDTTDEQDAANEQDSADEADSSEPADTADEADSTEPADTADEADSSEPADSSDSGSDSSDGSDNG